VIPKFLSDLSDNGKKLLTVALIIIVIALFDRLLIDPTMSRLSAINQDIAKEEKAIKQDLHFLGYKDKILKESKVFDPYLTKELPAEEEIIATFLKKVEMLANNANVTLIKVTPSTGTQEKEYLKYQADLECSGKLADVITFMHMVDTSNELMKVTKYNFSSKKADSDEIKAVLTVAKIVVAKRAVPAQVKPAGETSSKSTATDAGTSTQPSASGAAQ
jgi:hypothetical protein